MRKRLLSSDIKKISKKLNEIGDYFNVKDASEYIKINRLLSDWYISCIVEEELTPKDQKVEYPILKDVMIDYE